MDLNQIISDLKAELNRIDQAIAALEGSRTRLGRPPKTQSSRPGAGTRKMSAAARARIGAAKKAWWAAQKRKPVSPKGAAPAKKAPARKPMSPAARKKLSALAKARWAARKKAGATSL